MEESCEDCMKWEEDFYWTHFQTLHFSQFLLPGFHNRLVIPQKFSTHFKRKLPQTVTLKSPSRITYQVKIEEDNDKTLAFGFGWDRFVKDHSLEENDLLIFKFHGVSEFEVLVFDGQTLCEKPTSYFLRRCGHVNSIKASPTDCEQKENSNSDIGTSSQKENGISDIGTSSGQLPTISPSPTNTGQVSEGKYPISQFKRMRGAITNDTKDDVEVVSVIKKMEVLAQAKKAISPNGFLVVMKRSHVLTKCFLTIPYNWCMKNNLFARQEIVMQLDQKNWQMQFQYYVSSGRGGISTGWRKFVHDNNLFEGDVCVFEPVDSEAKPLHLNVYIFRVTTEVESSNNASPTDCEQKEHSNSEIGTSSGQFPTISPSSTGQVSERKYPEFKRMRGAISNDTKNDVEVVSVVRRCGHVDNTKCTFSTSTSSRYPKKLEDFNDVDIDTMLTSNFVVSPTDSEQRKHSNSDIGTSSGQLPTISPTSTGHVSEVKYPISEFKRMRGAISNDIKDDVEVVSVVKKMEVLAQAKKAISPNGFLVVMKRSHVLTKYFLTIPYNWCMKNNLFARQEIVMQLDQKNWQMQFQYYVSSGRGGISNGWRKFVHDNNLFEGDVCVFEPVDSEAKPLHLNVYIFRVTKVESSNNGC